jgi:hypothetical protein
MRAARASRDRLVDLPIVVHYNAAGESARRF